MAKRKVFCKECGTRLISLYFRDSKTLHYIPIKTLYCRTCKKPTEVNVMNWFNGE